MKPRPSSYRVAVLSHVGHHREHNEDLYAVFSSPVGEVFLVCDGMGGHGAGDVAARLAVDRIKEVLSGASAAHSPAYWLRRAFHEAHHAILGAGQAGQGALNMGTTAVALVLAPTGEAWWAHTGDSRLYLWRKGRLFRLTHDHSYVAYLIDSGQLTPEAEFDHPHSNQLLFSLGGLQGFTLVEACAYPLQTQKGDRFLLCSDGVSGLVPEKRIKATLAAKKSPTELAQDLIDQALEAGGHDNATVIVVEVAEGPAEAPPRESPWKVSLGVLAGFLIGLGGALWTFQGGGGKSLAKPGLSDSSQATAPTATTEKEDLPPESEADTTSEKNPPFATTSPPNKGLHASDTVHPARAIPGLGPSRSDTSTHPER